MHKEGKGFRRFKSRVNYFQEDIETVEVILENKETIKGRKTIFHKVDKTQHPKLFTRKNSRRSREVVLRHLLNTVFVSFIKDLYEEVLIYCAYATDCAAQSSPNANRLVGEQNYSFTANEILSKRDKKEIVSAVIGKVFRGIENKKDTLLLVSALNDRLGLGVGKDTISGAMPFLEARHKFVHSDGIVDSKYKTDYPNMELTDDNRIKLNSKIIKKASDAIVSLVTEYENAMTKNHLFPNEEYQ